MHSYTIMCIFGIALITAVVLFAGSYVGFTGSLPDLKPGLPGVVCRVSFISVSAWVYLSFLISSRMRQLPPMQDDRNERIAVDALVVEHLDTALPECRLYTPDYFCVSSWMPLRNTAVSSALGQGFLPPLNPAVENTACTLH